MEELPSVQNVVLKPLEANYLTVRRIAFACTTTIVAGAGFAAFYFIEKLQFYPAIYAAVAVGILFIFFGLTAQAMSFKNSGYALRQKDLFYRKGWLVQKTRIVPLNRIQHVSIQSGPIERYFGLASVSVFTAGSDGADFTIAGITNETASKIKEWISAQVTGGEDANEL